MSIVAKCFCLAILSLALMSLSPTVEADSPAKLKAPARTIRDITTLLDQYEPDPSKANAIRQILDQSPPETGDRKDLARFFKQQANAAQSIGAAQAHLEARRKVVDYGGEWDIVEDYSQLANAERMAGNLEKAIEAQYSFLSLANQANPRGYAGRKMQAYGFLSELWSRFGDFDRAAQAFKSAENELQNALLQRDAGYHKDSWVFNLDRINAFRQIQLGKLQNAETLFRHAQEHYPGVLSGQMVARDIGRSTRAFPDIQSDEYMAWLGFANQADLSLVIAAQGRMIEAELIVRAALQNAINELGRYSYYTGILVGRYVSVLLLQGRYAEAEQLARIGLDILRNVGTPENSLTIFDLRSELGLALVAQRRHYDALNEFNGMREAFGNLPSLQAQLARGNTQWALALIETGDAASALKMLDPLIASSKLWLGADHPDTVTLIAMRALALSRSGNVEASLKEFHSVQRALIAEALVQGDESSPFKAQTVALLLKAYLNLLGEVRGSTYAQNAGIDAANEAFRVADVLRGQAIQQAIVASAVRAASNDPFIGKEIRRQQDLKQETTALFRTLRDLMDRPPKQQLPNVIADMQKRVEAIRSELKQFDSNIAERFPAYDNLIRPHPPTISEARAMLNAGESLLNIFSSQEGTYVWAFQKDGPIAFQVVPINNDLVSTSVTKIRLALDPGDVDIARSLPPFDFDTAHELYTRLLLPVQEGWRGAKSLIVVANGALGQLPLSVSGILCKRGMG